MMELVADLARGIDQWGWLRSNLPEGNGFGYDFNEYDPDAVEGEGEIEQEYGDESVGSQKGKVG